MILLVPLMLAAAQPAPDAIANYQSCTALVKQDATRAAAQANDWLVKGGGQLARQCLGLAYVELGRWAPAATSFEAAAREAEKMQDPGRADFWVQAGNSWLAAGEAAKAQQALDAALATGVLSPQLQGEAWLDRARADVALNDPAAARRDLDKAIGLVPADPMAWYLSSALALRQDDLARAQQDIAKALGLAPEDPDLLVHAGNVAGRSGEQEAAEGFYAKAVAAAPNSPAGQAAKAALATNQAPPAPAPAKPPVK